MTNSIPAEMDLRRTGSAIRCCSRASNLDAAGWGVLSRQWVEILRVVCMRAIVGAGIAGAVCAAQENERSLLVAEFDVYGDGDSLLLPVNMHGARYFFEVDTGATRLCFDRSLRPMLGMVRESETIGTLGGPLRCELFEAPDALLGPLHLRLPPPGVTPLVACLDQEHRRLGSGHDVRGIIGTNFLRRHVVRIDFDRGKLSFLKAVGKEPGRPVPILFDEGKREVQARLPGMGDSMFLIDTGLVGWSGCLRSETARKLEGHGHATKMRTAWSADAVGAGETQFLRVSSFELAGFQSNGLVFSEHSRDLPNILGLNYWMRYIVTFDFPNRVLYLKPSRWFQERDVLYFSRADQAGIGLTRRHGNVAVSMVVENSSAARAGLRSGDVLLAIDGVDVAGERLLQVCKRIYHARQMIRMTILRGHQWLELILKLPVRQD